MMDRGDRAESIVGEFHPCVCVRERERVCVCALALKENIIYPFDDIQSVSTFKWRF